MTMRLKPAIGTLAAALLLGLPAFAGGGNGCATCAPVEATECSICAEESDCGCEAEEEEASCDFLNRSLIGSCLSERTGFSVYGWLNGGFTTGGVSTAGNPAANDLSPVGFNDANNDFMLNQFYLVAEKAIDYDADKIQLGGRVDMLYGTDARTTYAYGLDINTSNLTPAIIGGSNNYTGAASAGSGVGDVAYGVAIPQMYGSLYIPIGNGLEIIGGHYYTSIGYEVVTAPDNFFYSHAYTMYYGEPFTHTGFNAKYTVNDMISVFSGLNRGWDNWYDNNDEWSYLGGITFSLGENTTLAFAIETGAEQDDPPAAWQGISAANGTKNRTMYSIVLQQQITEKLSYVFQHDLGVQAIGAVDSAAFGGANELNWYGINQYLFYDVNDKFALGLRGEWFCDEDGYRIFTAPTRTPGTRYNVFEITVGANYKPASCMVIRPEVRYDWQTTGNNIYAAGAQDSLFTAAVDFILSF